MIGDESPWLVNLILTISLLPIVIGSLGEHVGTRILGTAILLLVSCVTIYTLVGGQIIEPPRSANIDGDSVVGGTYDNPLAVHQSGEKTESTDEEE